MVEDDPVVPSNSPLLKYTTLKSKGNQVSKMANPSSNARQQYVENVGLVLNNESAENSNIFNIQLNYDIDQALDPESWDSNF